MNIAIIGYGKMGQTIERIARSRGHNIALIKDETPAASELKNIDVAIDFSFPNAAFNNIKVCLENGVRVVSGTTGWLENYPKAVEICNQNQNGFIYASNYSVGVNLFFKLNKILAQMMAPHLNEYTVETEEIHHNQKLDAPSGTAITLAEGIIENTSLTDWYLVGEESKENAVPIKAKRIGVIPGTHSIHYESVVDSIEIKHTAHTREGFALGAVVAAEWLNGKVGVFDMQDVLGLKGL